MKLDPKFLRVSSKPVNFEEEKTTNLQKLGQEMIDLMKKEKGIGLASNQIGLDKRIFVCDFSLKSNYPGPRVCINPSWKVHRWTWIQSQEGCLSLPDVVVTVPRIDEIEATWFGTDGKEYSDTLYGIDAVVFQHEYDHLEGKLITDYITIM